MMSRHTSIRRIWLLSAIVWPGIAVASDGAWHYTIDQHRAKQQANFCASREGVEEIAGIIQEISRDGVPVVLVEQNAELALGLADYAYVLETGDLAMEGPSQELHDNEHVRAAYLGV